MSAGTCVPCGAALRSARQYICLACVQADRRAFRRVYPFVDERTHQRDLNAWYADFDARVAAIRSERALAVVA